MTPLQARPLPKIDAAPADASFDLGATNVQALRQRVAELEAQLAATRETASAYHVIATTDFRGVVARATDVPELEPEVEKYGELSSRRGTLNRRLAENPPDAAQLSAQERALAAQQLELAEGMRARLLGDPRLMAQVEPDEVGYLKDQLDDLKRQLAAEDWSSLR